MHQLFSPTCVRRGTRGRQWDHSKNKESPLCGQQERTAQQRPVGPPTGTCTRMARNPMKCPVSATTGASDGRNRATAAGWDLQIRKRSNRTAKNRAVRNRPWFTSRVSVRVCCTEAEYRLMWGSVRVGGTVRTSILRAWGG